jgi:hypothetical protein
MADDSSLIPAAQTRRERLFLARRRRRTRLAVSSALIVAVCGSAGAYAVTRHDDPTDGAGATATSTSSADPGRAGAIPGLATLRTKSAPRAISHDAPLKLWVGGDSLAGGLGPALGQIAGATGVVHTQVDYKVSSGLSSNGVRDWQQRAQQQMAQYDPEAIVFEIGTNDASIVNSHLNADGVPEWEPAYRVEVARMMDTLRGSTDDPRTVIWVGAPTMQLGWRDKGVQELNRVMREEADKRAPDVVYVDAYKLFGDENGDYTSRLRTLTGNVERVRIGDGVHFTEEGANYLGAVVFSLLDARWQIEKHADRAQPIVWEQSIGSGEYSGGSGSGSGSGSHRRTYTPGTPAPPPSFETTAPPSTDTPASTDATAPPASTSPATTSPGTTAAPPADSTPATAAPSGGG